MKKPKQKSLLFLFIAMACCVIFSAYKEGPAQYAGYDCTGAETGLGNSAGCSCHGNNATSTIAVTLELDSAGVATTHYVAGMSYTVKITGTNNSTHTQTKFGLQIGCIEGSTAATTPTNAGTWAAPYPTNTHYAAPAAGKFVVGIVEHGAELSPSSGTGANGTVYTETFNWTAPTTGVGTISFWGALNAVNNDGSDNGDYWNDTHIVITQYTPASLSASAIVNTNATECANTGKATVTPSGGTAPYTYSWTTVPVQTTASATGLSAGTYTVTVKDNAGNSATASAVITEPPALNASASTTANVTCHGDANGSASTTVTGGTLPYTYSWTGGGTSATISGLTAGNYTVTIKDKNGCTSSSVVTITQPTILSASATTTANVTCSTTGGTSSTVSGGTLPYTYLWSGGGGNNPTTTGLGAGTYTLTVTDNNGCTSSATTTITQPAGTVGASASVTANVTCHGESTGSASSTITGGTTPYTYSWSGGAGTNATATGLSAGVYTLTVTDKGGCTSIATITITQPASLSVSTAITNISCNGDNNGSASASISGGTSPYTYLWSGGIGTNTTVTGLSAGIYTLAVTDACGGDLATVSVTITQPFSLNASANTTANVSCNGGDNGIGSSTVTGGTMPYTYLWTGGGTNATATGLTTGTYTLSVVDNHGCTSSSTVTITQPTAIGVTEYSKDDNGSGNGIAAVTVSGGTMPYTYLWTPGGETTDTIKNQSANTYCCNITDANGCTNSTCVTISSSTGINSISNGSTINVYPDPSSGYFTVAGLVQGQVIDVYNYMGQKLSSILVTNNTMHIDISNRTNGIYLIRIEATDGSIVTEKKMLKMQ